MWMLKGLGRCGVMSKGEEESLSRSIDKSNAQYSKQFKPDTRAHSEEAKQGIQRASVTDGDLQGKSSASMNPVAALLSKGPVERFKQEQSARENALCPRKRRQLRKACEQYACGMFGGFNHAI
jgi:hypothetical protein